FKNFDYNTISDVIIHIRYTARQGINPVKVKESVKALFEDEGTANLALILSLRHDFPNEWGMFKNDKGKLAIPIRRDFFPYFTQGKTIKIYNLHLFGEEKGIHHTV